MKRLAWLIILCTTAAIMCLPPAAGTAESRVRIANSEWNNRTRTKVITVAFDSQEYNALDYDVRVSVWCRVGPGGAPRLAAENERITLSPKRIGSDWEATGTRDVRIEYHELFGTYPERRYCYYRYIVTCTHDGETRLVRESEWNRA